MEQIISSLIVGILAFLGVVVTNVMNNNKIQGDLKSQQRVTDTKLDELTREVRKHNNFAERVPVIEEQIKVINHRIQDLEDYINP